MICPKTAEITLLVWFHRSVIGETAPFVQFKKNKNNQFLFRRLKFLISKQQKKIWILPYLIRIMGLKARLLWTGKVGKRIKDIKRSSNPWAFLSSLVIVFSPLLFMRSGHTKRTLLASPFVFNFAFFFLSNLFYSLLFTHEVPTFGNTNTCNQFQLRII